MDVIKDSRQVEELDDRLTPKTTRPQHEAYFVIQDEAAVLLPQALSGAFEHEPLASFLKSLTFEEHFMFSHYVQEIAPNLEAQCPVVNYLGQKYDNIRGNWLLLGSTDINLLRGFLLAACRHLSFHQGELYSEWAIQYKLKHVQDLRECLSADDPASRRTSVAKALVLAFDEIMLRDMTMASRHLLGAIQIIHEAGGLEILGLSNIVRCVLDNCMYGKGILDWDPSLNQRILL
ncbi:hypothetical protein CT0861_07107 [Colletotrichum tofieldiae]|uniref:Uncharacterized protein n=1 Tax=Colletotrichum tofieldiae TaxID=708197 RepID=A0A166SA25_9PEZI|nr:hypothetical protein CT0861_07107 [Colletotrichum tofieldiae]